MSIAKGEWDTTAQARLDELEKIHRDARGPGPGRRWGTEQLNRSLFLVLVAQFQTYCRGLHDEAVDVYVSAANPRQAVVLRSLLTQGRHLDNRKPRPGTLGRDFGRLDIELLPTLRAARSTAAYGVDGLEALIDFRNAVAHGNESELAGIVATGRVRATLKSYRAHRRALDDLVSTMDHVVSTELAKELQIAEPW